MNVLFCAATGKELSIIKSEVKKLKFPIKINFLNVGIGPYNSIFNLTKFLQENKIDFLVNIGICGYRGSSNPEKFYQVGNIIDLCSGKELIVPSFFEFCKLITCISSAKPIKNVFGKLSDLNLDFPEVVLDMEAFYIEFVASKYNLPSLFLKFPIDLSDGDLNLINFSKSVDVLKDINYDELLGKIFDFLKSIDLMKE